MKVLLDGKEIDHSELDNGNYTIGHPDFAEKKDEYDRVTFPVVDKDEIPNRVKELAKRNSDWEGIVPIVEAVSRFPTSEHWYDGWHIVYSGEEMEDIVVEKNRGWGVKV